jgi:uncharacterized membrane protein required for colicin V production
MGILDFVALAYIGYAALKGRKRGLSTELPGAISIAIFLATGCGLYRWTGRAFVEFNHLTGQTLNALGFAGLVAATVASVRYLRQRARDWVERRYDISQRKLGGMMVGAGRAFLLVCVALLVLAHWPLHSLTRPFTESSALGRCLTKWVLPVYEKTHGTL